MAKKKEKPEFEKEETMEQPQPRKRKLLHWFIAAGVLAAAFTFFATRQSSESADPGLETAPDAANQAPQEVLAQEMGNPPPPAEGELPGDPALAGAEEPMPIPPPVTADPDAENAAPPAEPEMQAQVNEPEAAPLPVKKKAAPKKTETKANAKSAAKKYTLRLNRKGTKVPAALSKDKVLSYLNKKLDGDKTCIPSSLKAKEVKPFSATVAVSKTGSITGVDIKPKLPQAKAITSCLKKKLAGNNALFKGKGKSANKITVAFKVK